MAQDLLDRFTPLHTQPINSNLNVATLVLRNGHRAMKLPQGLERDVYFANVLSSLYNNSGILVTLVWTMAAAAGSVQFEIAFERQAAGVFNFTTASFASGQTVIATPPSSANLAVYTTLTFANGVAIDSLVALESYRLRVRRLNDGVAQDVYLYRVFLQNAT